MRGNSQEICETEPQASVRKIIEASRWRGPVVVPLTILHPPETEQSHSGTSASQKVPMLYSLMIQKTIRLHAPEGSKAWLGP